jgi:hypothetical protein
MFASCILRQPWYFCFQCFFQLGWGLTGVRSTQTECFLNDVWQVNSAVAEDDGKLGFHSVRITAKAPAQWASNPAVSAAPKCSGGDGIPKRN